MTFPAGNPRPAPGDYAPFYAGYVNRVPDGDLLATLGTQQVETRELLATDLARERADLSYAPGKWTLKQVVGHMADTERVMAYRALSFARGDASPLPSFDENSYTSEGRFNERSLEDLADDFATARASTLSLFRGFSDDFWLRSGTASGLRVTVLALGYIVAGHELHHKAGILERYLR